MGRRRKRGGRKVNREPMQALAHKPTVHMWTDGSCYPNPGPGGWAVVLRYLETEEVIQISGGCEYPATNNTAEMQAVIEGLMALGSSTSVNLYSDSLYVINGIGAWCKGNPIPNHHGYVVRWRNNGWRRSDGRPVPNRPLWESLRELAASQVLFVPYWVRGHSGNEWNEWCDKAAAEERKKCELKLTG
mgnify:CR=1 FL=1